MEKREEEERKEKINDISQDCLGIPPSERRELYDTVLRKGALKSNVWV